MVLKDWLVEMQFIMTSEALDSVGRKSVTSVSSDPNNVCAPIGVIAESCHHLLARLNDLRPGIVHSVCDSSGSVVIRIDPFSVVLTLIRVVTSITLQVNEHSGVTVLT